MTSKEIEKFRKRLVEVLKRQRSDERTAELYELAKEIGASTGRRRSGEDVDPVGLVDNIHYALQTASMVDMCRTAGRNYWIAFVASLIAFLSAAAAWAAVYVNILAKMSKTLYL